MTIEDVTRQIASRPTPPFVNCTYVTRDTRGAEPKWVILGGHGGHMILFLAIFLVAMVVYIPDSSNRA